MNIEVDEYYEREMNRDVKLSDFRNMDREVYPEDIYDAYDGDLCEYKKCLEREKAKEEAERARAHEQAQRKQARQKSLLRRAKRKRYVASLLIRIKNENGKGKNKDANKKRKNMMNGIIEHKA